MLVGRYPTAAIAEVARRDLKQLYARLEPAAPPVSVPALVVPSPVPATRNTSEPAPAAQPKLQILRIQPIQPRSPAQLSIAALADRFRNDAGDRIFFSDGSAELGSRARIALEAQAQWLRQAADTTVTIEGHADDRGAADYNSVLAQRRADAVRQRLIETGIAPERIAVLGLGRSRPIALCRDETCGAQNRRAVTTVTGFLNAAVAPNVAEQGMATAPPEDGVARRMPVRR